MENLMIFVGTIFLLVVPGLTFKYGEDQVRPIPSGNNSDRGQASYNQSKSEEINAHFYPVMKNTNETFSPQVLTTQTLKGENLTESKPEQSMTRLDNSSIISAGNTSHKIYNNTSIIQWKINSSLPDNSHMFINSCPPFYYPCDDNKTCIPSELVCNGISECQDHSDEFGVCQAKEIEVVLCNDGQILKGNNMICNSIRECADGSDEIGCEASSQESCEDSMLFSCRDSRNTCVHNSKRCDSYYDCENGLDEFPILCSFRPTVHIKTSFSYRETVIIYESPKTCGFECDDIKQCLSKNTRCDGYVDCSDGTDESDCYFDTDGSPEIAKKSIYTKTVPIIAMTVVALSLFIVLMAALYFGKKKRRQLKSRAKMAEVNKKIASYHHLVTPPAYEEVTKSYTNTATEQNQNP